MNAFHIAEWSGNHWKSLYCPVVMIDGTVLLLQSVFNSPQKGVSISTVPTSALSRLASHLEASQSLCISQLLWLMILSCSCSLYLTLHRMAFRFQHSQHQPFLDWLVIWKPPKVLLFPSCYDWWYCLSPVTCITLSTKRRFDFTSPNIRPFNNT